MTEDDVGLVTASKTKPVDAAYKDIAKLRLAAKWCTMDSYGGKKKFLREREGGERKGESTKVSADDMKRLRYAGAGEQGL